MVFNDLGPSPVPALLSDAGPGEANREFHSSHQWPARRRDIIARLEPLLGEPPDRAPALEVEWHDGERLEHYRRHRVSYQVEPQERCHAWLLVPEPARLRSPGVVCCHSMTVAGKDEPAGLTGPPEAHLALELVRQGYVCVVADTIGAGERVYPGAEPFDTSGFYARHPRWSAGGKMLWDHQRALDCLSSLDVVDQDRLGVIGHGLGGVNALLLGAFDHRIKVTAASCAYTPFAVDPDPMRWCRDQGLVGLPLLGPYLRQRRHPPFAWVELLALMAPRYLHYTYAVQDETLPHSAFIREDMSALGRLYDLLGCRACLGYYEHEGAHEYPVPARRAAYRLMANAFGGGAQ